MMGPFQAVALAKAMYDNQVRYILPEPEPFERLSEPTMTQWLKDAGEVLDALHAAGWTLAPIGTPGTAGKPQRDANDMAAILSLTGGDRAMAERWYDQGVRVTRETRRVDPETYRELQRRAYAEIGRELDEAASRNLRADPTLPWWRKFWPF